MQLAVRNNLCRKPHRGVKHAFLPNGDFKRRRLLSLRYFYGEEPVTQGKKYEEALAMAADWLLSVATIAKEKQDELQSLLSPKTEKL